ncbi:MAG: ATP-grasp domain-containing protein [Phycisphaerae bacterium]|nr:ATP-grasp domain-containing protein [Phycisphaerae bacterium]
MNKEQIKSELNVLFTCVGRRVSLLESFRDAGEELGLGIKIFGTELEELNPALHVCDEGFIVPKIRNETYIERLLDIVSKKKAQLIVPTIDLDLEVLSKNKQLFEDAGCTVLVSSSEVIATCQDKRKMSGFLKSNGFADCDTTDAETVMAEENIRWPLFLKPYDGHASKNNAIVKSREELAFFAKRIPNCIVQKYISGTEFTCDTYVDFAMRVRCVVPRKRIEVRAGEVSKGQVVRDERIEGEVKRVVEKLGAGPGVITVQLFNCDDGQIRFIEVNPRFGGGVPLSIRAGANFPRWILQELTCQQPNIEPEKIMDKLIMLRFDAEIWIEPYNAGNV